MPGLYRPLQIAGSLGVALVLLSGLVIVAAPVLRLDGMAQGLGEASILEAVAFLGGMQLLCLGAILLLQLRAAGRVRALGYSARTRPGIFRREVE